MKRATINPALTKEALYHEWLVTNGLGGYACGTLCGMPMRRHHSLLTAALPAPYGRTIMLNYVSDSIMVDQENIPLSHVHAGDDGDEKETFLERILTDFRLENGNPHWVYKHDNIVVEKSLFMIYRQNTVCISYKIVAAPAAVILLWRPYFHFRLNEQPVDGYISDEAYSVNAEAHHYEISGQTFPNMRITNDHPTLAFTVNQHKFHDVFYQIESERGYQHLGDLTSPGYFTTTIGPGQRATFVASTEPWETIEVLKPKEAWHTDKMRKRNLLKVSGAVGKSPLMAKLILAADQFIMTPHTRYRDMVRMQAAGEEIRSVTAGFPWFADWGRDTMISLEGLTLTTGRKREAYAILHTFAHYVRDGLIPNMFPEGQNEGIYNTADASLWFFHAINQYIEITGDDEILEFLLPTLHEIIESHLKGTLFGIKADSDGLLIQGQEGYQLTWMDAKVDDWVVTPRRGKAVEINGLWYNALRLYELWTGNSLGIVERCYEAFNQKFWFEQGQYLYDVVEGPDGKNDPALRPNQLFAISMRFPVLQRDRWAPVLKIVKDKLLTPVGLRTLSPSHPDYKSQYDGDLRARDASYHQGTVWPWLFGPFIDVWLKVYPDDYSGAYQFIKPLTERLDKECIGSIGEIFDASPPYRSRGCFAQAWSVAELLRCLAKILPNLPAE